MYGGRKVIDELVLELFEQRESGSNHMGRSNAQHRTAYQSTVVICFDILQDKLLKDGMEFSSPILTHNDMNHRKHSDNTSMCTDVTLQQERETIRRRHDKRDGRQTQSTAYRGTKPLLELCVGLEDLRHQEMHQRPQLHEVVLQRGASEKQAAPTGEAEQRLPSLGLKVLDLVRLVQDHVLPLLPTKRLMVLHSKLVARDTNVEDTILGPPLALLLAFLDRSVVRQDFERGAELLELNLPVEHDARRDNHEMRAPVAFLHSEVREKRNRLDSLA